MVAKTAIEAAEMAAEYFYHFMMDMGSDDVDAINAAAGVYKHITGEEKDMVEFLGLEEDDIHSYEENQMGYNDDEDDVMADEEFDEDYYRR